MFFKDFETIEIKTIKILFNVKLNELIVRALLFSIYLRMVTLVLTLKRVGIIFITLNIININTYFHIIILSKCSLRRFYN